MQRKAVISMLVLTPALLAAAAATVSYPDARLPEAVKGGNRAEVEKLLREHVPVNSAEGDGTTALHWAAYDDNLDLAKILLNAHADVNATTRIEALTPLELSCRNGDAAMIALLLDHGAKANGADSLGTTPLMIAAASGSAAAVQTLIAHGADVNARENAHDQTALMFAANLNRADVVRVLLAHGADPNLESKVFAPPKFRMNKNGTLAQVIDMNGSKASIEAAEKADEEDAADEKKAENAAAVKPVSSKTEAKPADSAEDAIKKMYRERGAKAIGGMTALDYAARQGNIAATIALLQGGAKIDLPNGSEHATPLVLAITNGHYDEARVLIEHGANVNIADSMGVAPLFATIDVQWAPHEWSPEPVVEQEHTDYLVLMKLLIAHGADLNARIIKQPWYRTLSENRNWTDPAGATAFWRAAWADDVNAMKLLKDAGADTSITTKNGTTPLMAAAGLGWSANYSTTAPTRMEAVKYCLSLGENINQADNLGFTALHGAAFVGDLDLIRYMVAQGAKTDARTKAGDTVADYANGPFEKSLPNPKAVALLVSLGSPDSNNCRSSDCVPPVKPDKKPEVASNKGEVAVNPAAEAKKPVVK